MIQEIADVIGDDKAARTRITKAWEDAIQAERVDARREALEEAATGLAIEAQRPITGEASRMPQYAAGVTYGLQYAYRLIASRVSSPVSPQPNEQEKV
jgi:hypothetical protein